MQRLSCPRRWRREKAALGYFVDVFDIQLFGIVRVRSLQSLGLTPEEVTNVGALLLNWQMAGMLLGGLLVLPLLAVSAAAALSRGCGGMAGCRPRAATPEAAPHCLRPFRHCRRQAHRDGWAVLGAPVP